MLYICTHMATVGVKGLNEKVVISTHITVDIYVAFFELVSLPVHTFVRLQTVFQFERNVLCR